jgi:hypothetical protein
MVLLPSLRGRRHQVRQRDCSQFGELEQNLGGSEAVFGAYAASIQKTGEEAYKNLGVSKASILRLPIKWEHCSKAQASNSEKALS